MKEENNKQTSCEQQNSSVTQVSTTYARICVMLLALNFCVTGYVMAGMIKLQQETQASTQTPAAPAQIAGDTITSPTTSSPATTVPEVQTLEKE